MIYVRLIGKLNAKEVADEITDYALKEMCDNGRNVATGFKTVNGAANTLRIVFR